VVPTLDVTSDEVRECLRGVKATVRAPHELIVIDNGAPPQGVAAPVNAGFRAARGRHLVLLNDDVEVLEGWWEPLARALDAGADVVFPTTTNGKMSRFPAWCFAMRRDTLDRFAAAPGEFLDPALTIWCWDTDLWLRLCEADMPPVHVRESRIRHAFHRTADLEHPDDGYRGWLHAQFTSDHAALRVKHPGGYFLLERERIRPVLEDVGGRSEEEHAGGQPVPTWSAVRKVIVRCASAHEASVTVTNLRAFAETAAVIPLNV
jgi:glycosyltransferase involved in cell wall biosynthesis